MIGILEQSVAVWEIQKQKDLVKKIVKESCDITVPSIAKKRQLEVFDAKKVKIGK
jgi:hypothetical protein